MHIFLTGQVQVGKSTLIKKAVKRLDGLRVGGFRTVTVADIPGATGSVYIIPGGSNPETAPMGDENRVGIRWGQGKKEAFPAAFDGAGTALLAAGGAELILMDEAGFMENGAAKFRARALELLDGDVPVLGVVKPGPGPLPDAIRAHKNVELITVTEENRDALADILTQKLRLALGGVWLEPEADSCGAVVLRGGGGEEQVLLISTGSGRWSFPKGHMEPGETEAQTALREIFEETGVTVRLEPGFRMSVDSARSGDRRRIIFFLARYEAGEVQPLYSELSGAGWFAASQAERMISFPQDRLVLRRALEHAARN